VRLELIDKVSAMDYKGKWEENAACGMGQAVDDRVWPGCSGYFRREQSYPFG